MDRPPPTGTGSLLRRRIGWYGDRNGGDRRRRRRGRGRRHRREDSGSGRIGGGRGHGCSRCGVRFTPVTIRMIRPRMSPSSSQGHGAEDPRQDRRHDVLAQRDGELAFPTGLDDHAVGAGLVDVDRGDLGAAGH